MRLKKKSNEVYQADEPIVAIGGAEIELLKQSAGQSPMKRSRICAHRQSADALHEMLIVLERGSYIRPHRHLGKSESFHFIEGEADVLIFDDKGAIADVIQMGPQASGRSFFYRLADPLFHTLIIRSERVVFHETTNGPFRKEDTIFALWSPADKDKTSVEQYLKLLIEASARFLAGQPHKSSLA